jgi:hypothetical protein
MGIKSPVQNPNDLIKTTKMGIIKSHVPNPNELLVLPIKTDYVNPNHVVLPRVKRLIGKRELHYMPRLRGRRRGRGRTVSVKESPVLYISMFHPLPPSYIYILVYNMRNH